MRTFIPVCEPYLWGNEAKLVNDCIETGWISSAGKYIQQFEESFAKYCGAKYGIAVSNGTTALHLALASLGIGSGDEVIIPTFTIISTALAVIYTGAKPVLVDSEKETWNIDVEKIEEKITKKTKAIMPVHIYGHPCEMDKILSIAKKYNLKVIEDCAEVHGAEYKGKRVPISDIGCFSFYANKLITTGEGGMIVTNDEGFANKAKRLRNLAHSEKRRFLHEEIGFNYRLTNIQAAIGVAQLEKLDEAIERRRKNAMVYNKRLKEVNCLTLPKEKEWAKNVYWMYSILISNNDRDLVINKLKKEGVDTRTFFIPMHKQPIFKKMGLFKGESYLVAEDISNRGLYLPSGTGLTEEEIDYVCNAIEKVTSEKR